MNNVRHPLFNSLSEAENEKPNTITFDASKHNLKDAFTFVNLKERSKVQGLLADPKRRHEVQEYFKPRLHQILSRKPTVEFIQA